MATAAKGKASAKRKGAPAAKRRPAKKKRAATKKSAPEAKKRTSAARKRARTSANPSQARKKRATAKKGRATAKKKRATAAKKPASAKRTRGRRGGARAMWKGALSIGGVSVPVKLYAAAADRAVHFRLLAGETLNPLRQRMVNPETGEEVPADRVRRGYPTEDGRFVVLSGEELASLEPEPSRDIEVTRFVDAGALRPPWYDRPYWLGPDGDEAGYAALVDVLSDEGKEGIARWVMRKKEYAGALRAEEGHLMLVTLRHAGEVVPASALSAPAGRAPERQELRMAEQLVEALAGDFEPSEYRDEYRERVLELVDAKGSGRKVKPIPFRREAASDRDLARTLEESLAAARRAA